MFIVKNGRCFMKMYKIIKNIKNIDRNKNNPDVIQEIHYAILQDDIKKLEYLINIGSDVNATFNDHIGSELQKELSSPVKPIAGAGTLHKYYCETTPIVLAARYGNLEIVKLLLINGANFEILNNGWTAIHEAAFFGNFNVFEYLVNLNFDINKNAYPPILYRHGTPLHIACRFNNLKMVRLLILKKANVNIIDKKSNSTAIFNLFIKKFEDLDYFFFNSILLKNHFDYKNNSLNDRISSAWKFGFGQTKLYNYNNILQSVNLLLKAGVDVNTFTHGYGSFLLDKSTILHLALNKYTFNNLKLPSSEKLCFINFKKELIELILSYKPNINAKDCLLRTPLDLADGGMKAQLIKLGANKGHRILGWSIQIMKTIFFILVSIIIIILMISLIGFLFSHC